MPVAEGAEIVLGRAATSDVVLDHDGISRRHAAVRRRGDGLLVTDLGSTNGTLVNNAAITAPRRVSAGDVITLGPATAIVATSSAARKARQVATATELEDRLEGEVDRASRYKRPLGLVMLRLEGTTEQVYAHVEGLLRQLRRMDLVAEYGTEELAIVLPEASPDAVAVVAKRACAVSAGLVAASGAATFPEDGAHAGELISVARERLRGARTSGRARTVPPKPPPDDIVVVDPLMKQVFQLAARAASSPITVLIAGETGAGKEVVAEALHRLGQRAKGPFVRLNCAALPEALVESELFGHEKGAFTGAIGQKTGYFQAAAGGTLFLDEIGELPPGTQAKLLRVLEQRKITRVGGTKEIAVDVRLVCATNRDLDLEVKRGRFRADLYFRISAFVIPVPPLRDRRTEIGPLASRFARELSAELGDRIAAIGPDAFDALKAYDWPGNVRELRNVIERAVVLSGGGKIELSHLPDRIREGAPRPVVGGPVDVRQKVAEVERDAVVAALEATAGNQTQAARRLGVSRFALIRLMDKHGLKTRR